MRLLFLFCLLVNLFLLSSCKKYQPADSSFFIKSDGISVATATASQGSGSNKITDLWLYVNGKFQGAYPIGNLMPIANKGANTTINILAGIKNNGISDTRIYYPFYDIYALDTLVTAGKTISKSFVFKYKPNTQFLWMENFESSVGFSLKASDNNDGGIFKYTNPGDGFEGKSFVASLTGSGQQIAWCESTGSGFSLPSASSDIFLELNYKSNVAFTVGLMTANGTPQSADAVVVNPQANWNKIYIQLSTAVSTLNASKYQVFFKFVKTDDVDKQVFLDNIKLLYLQ